MLYSTKMKKLLTLGLILSFLFTSVPVNAEQINKFGIHILEPSEVFLARELVNSSGGDWGFVTIVIRTDDMKVPKWQKFFDDCRELHLVPIIRIATHQEKDYWAKPKYEDIDKWVEFFSSLNWPAKDRYIVIFNEPNHKKEWGGELNPQEYAHILNKAIDDFHKQSFDYKILNAGFDLASSNTSTTREALNFWTQMDKEIPGIFNKIDGWTSHSYPNHGFVGSPYDSGKASVKGYQWELATLEKRFQVTKDLPVFITETGWPYKISKKEIFWNENKAAEYLMQTFQNIWLPDQRVVAITPFVLFYPQLPFANFSCIKADNSKSIQFIHYREIPKQSWWPNQNFSFVVEKIQLPPFIPTHTEFYGNVKIRNTGQSIWGEKDTIKFPAKNSEAILSTELALPQEAKIKPGESVTLNFTLKTGSTSGVQTLSWDQFPSYELSIIPSTPINKVKYSFWQGFMLFFKHISFKLVNFSS